MPCYLVVDSDCLSIRVSMCALQGCFLLDAANFKLKERFAFSEIQQIAVSSRTDGIVVLRLPVDGPNARVRPLSEFPVNPEDFPVCHSLSYTMQAFFKLT